MSTGRAQIIALGRDESAAAIDSKLRALRAAEGIVRQRGANT